VEDVLAGCFRHELPERLIGDKAYGTEMILPNQSNRKQKTHDGRPLGCHRRRWKAENIFAWMQNYRRLLTRWEAARTSSDICNPHAS
jgi:hypothetical protein